MPKRQGTGFAVGRAVWQRHKARAEALTVRAMAAASALWDRLRRLEPVALAYETARDFTKDECPLRAAAIAYYGLFSLFPLAIGLTALGTWVFELLGLRSDLVGLLAAYFPGAEPLLRQNVEQAIALRGPATAVALAGLIWSARGVFAAVLAAVNRAWEVRQPRSPLQSTLLEIGLVLFAGLFLLFSLLTTAVLRLLLAVEVPFIDWRPFDNSLWQSLATLVPFAFSLVIFLVVYRFLPNLPIGWADVWPGALLAAVLFELGKNGFLWYTQTFARFELIYGSLGAVIALLLWAYLSAQILLLGAELASVVWRRRRGLPPRES